MKNKILKWLGGDPTEFSLLWDVFKRERNLRILEGKSDQIDMSSLKILVVFPLFLLTCLMTFMTYAFRHDAAMVTSILLTVHASIFLTTLLYDIVMGLLGDEDLRVIGSWPIKSNSVLLARLYQPFKTSMVLALSTGGLASLAACIFVGTPILTGLTMLVTLIVFAIGLMLLASAVISILLWLFGVDNLRTVAVFVGMAFMGVFFMASSRMDALQESDMTALEFGFHLFPTWLPSAWAGAFVGLTDFDLTIDPLFALLGLLWLVAVPVFTFRYAARSYVRLLLNPRRRAKVATGLFFYKLFTWGSKRPADHVLAKLCLAHARHDWRFRAQAFMIPVFCLLMLVSIPFGVSDKIFDNPLVRGDNFLHASMYMMVIIMVPPIFALPLLASSSEYKAAWVLRMGQITIVDFRLAAKRLLRLMFVLPFLVTIGVIYLIKGVPLLDFLPHLIMLALLADTMVAALQVLFTQYPMSLPSNDEDLSFKIIPYFLALEMLGLLFSAFIYNVLYRWWWAYLIGVVMLLVSRRALLTMGLKDDSEPEEETVIEEVVSKNSTTPLIAAVKQGRFHTVKLLLNSANTDVDAVDEDNKSAAQWAKELGHTQIHELLTSKN